MTYLVLMVAGAAFAGEDDPLPHLRVDVTRRCVDLDATVVTREADWLELLACTPNSREYEAILTVAARPSHLHLALLMLGLRPGSPLQWVREGEQWVPVPPHGPTLAVSIIVPGQNPDEEIPAQRWIKDRHSGELLSDSHWLFAGSQFVRFQGQEVYKADLNGSVISLVNFGDDVLTRPTTATNMTDEAQWGPVTAAIPPVGTAVIVRLRVVEPPPAASQPAPRS